MKDLYKLEIEKKYGDWYYSYIEGKRAGSITYYLYDANKKQVAKFKEYFQLRKAIISGDIKGYQEKNCYFGEYETYFNGKLVTNVEAVDLTGL